MFIPFGGQWINPAHITRMAYYQGKRLTISLADGQPSITEYAKSIEKGTPDVDVDEKFKRIISAPLAFRGVAIDGAAHAAEGFTPIEPPAAAAHVTVTDGPKPPPQPRSRKR